MVFNTYGAAASAPEARLVAYCSCVHHSYAPPCATTTGAKGLESYARDLRPFGSGEAQFSLHHMFAFRTVSRRNICDVAFLLLAEVNCVSYLVCISRR